MTQLAILEYPDPRLRKKALPVDTVDDALRQLIDDMIETMYACNGIGLAATQVNVQQRLLVLDISETRNNVQIFVNPVIVASEGRHAVEEGCLSVPGVYDKVQRAQSVVVRAMNRDGEAFELAADGLLAVCVQHEIDHLDGKLFVDYLSELKRALIRKRLGKERRQRAPAGEARSAVPVI